MTELFKKTFLRKEISKITGLTNAEISGILRERYKKGDNAFLNKPTYTPSMRIILKKASHITYTYEDLFFLRLSRFLKINGFHKSYLKLFTMLIKKNKTSIESLVKNDCVFRIIYTEEGYQIIGISKIDKSNNIGKDIVCKFSDFGLIPIKIKSKNIYFGSYRAELNLDIERIHRELDNCILSNVSFSL